MTWIPDLLGSDVSQDGGAVSQPRRKVLDFNGFTVMDDPATGRKRIFNVPAGEKAAVHAVTATALPANTRNGNDFAANSNGALASIDGVSTFVGMRFIDKDHATQAHRGVMRLTDVGSGSSTAKWTRDADGDASIDFVSGGQWRALAGGAANGGKVFTVSVSGGFVLNTDAIVFTAVNALGVYNVRDFGAAGNGSTNDTTAIANAIAACIANGGGTVFFPKGTYPTDNLTVNAATGVRLIGEGPGASIIKARQSGHIVTFDTCTECGFENLAIERKDSLFQTATGYSLRFTDLCVRCWTDNIRISYCSSAILVEQSFFTHCRGRTTVDHVNAGGGSGALRCVGKAGIGVGRELEVDWLEIEVGQASAITGYVGSRANTTAYTAGQVMFHSDLFWQCTTPGTSAGSPPAGLSSRPGTDGPSAYSTGVTDGTVVWNYIIGNNFMLDLDFGFSNVWVKRLDCRGPAVRPVLMRRSNGSEPAPSGLTIGSGRIEQSLFGPLFEAGTRVRWFNPDISRVWADGGIVLASGQTGDVQIIGGKVELCFGAGIFIDCDDVTVTDTEVLDCGQQGSNLHHGVLVGNDDSLVRLKGLYVSGSLHNHAIGLSASAVLCTVIGCVIGSFATGGISNPNISNVLEGNTGGGEEWRPRFPGVKFGGFLADSNATLNSSHTWVSRSATTNRTFTLGTTGVTDGDERAIINVQNLTHTEGASGITIAANAISVFKRVSGAWQLWERKLLSV